MQLAGIDGIRDKRIPCPRHERPRSGECLEWMLYCTSSMPRLWLLCAKAAAQDVPNLENPMAQEEALPLPVLAREIVMEA